MPSTAIKAGTLDRRVSLYEQRTVADALGGATTVLYHIATVWARVAAVAGRLVDGESQQRSAEADTEITIRYRSDVTQSAILVYQDQAYELPEVSEIGRREGLLLMARRILPQPGGLPYRISDFDSSPLVDFDGGQLMAL